jgi:hypothetical protein
MTMPRQTISIRGEYSILRRDRAHSQIAESFSFTKDHASGRVVRIAISYEDGSVEAQVDDLPVSAAVLEELSSLGRFDGPQLSDDARAAIEGPLDEMRQSVRDLLALIKYHLRHFDIRESPYSMKSQCWRGASNEWKEIPSSIFVSHESFSHQPLNEETHSAVQAALASSVIPLVAMRHLHRAKNESQPHHKWIDATIAAELAVKEVLCRAHPSMETMLIEMPSPPFSKMYGSLLNHYLGEESPFRKKLITGQERRNALVHRPGALLIDQQEANNYVAVVEAAIFHLLSLLYPKDELIYRARQFTARECQATTT